MECMEGLASSFACRVNVGARTFATNTMFAELELIGGFLSRIAGTVLPCRLEGGSRTFKKRKIMSVIYKQHHHSQLR